jgi:hypothetical protein
VSHYTWLLVTKNDYEGPHMTVSNQKWLWFNIMTVQKLNVSIILFFKIETCPDNLSNSNIFFTHNIHNELQAATLGDVSKILNLPNGSLFRNLEKCQQNLIWGQAGDADTLCL